MQMGEFKQAVLRINNRVNMEIFGQGLLSQRMDVIQNEVLITARNARVNLLSLTFDVDKNTTETMDRLLIVKFKKHFIEEVRWELGVTVLSHLKDYDPELEISISVSIFEKPIKDLLPYL